MGVSDALRREDFAVRWPSCRLGDRLDANEVLARGRRGKAAPSVGLGDKGSPTRRPRPCRESRHTR